ncbi:MAG: hypothetical protein GDA52_03930 [Rhodobacteraceae bacterium]|nr:hypothetical protein [Paracoccaceae bacterium]
MPAIRGGNSVALDPDSKGVIGKQAVAQAVPASLPGVASTAICLMVAASHGPPMIVHCHTPAGRVEYQENRACMNIRTCFIGPFPVVVIKGRDVWCLTRAGRVPV